MKKITDERLKIKNLKVIRLAFVIQYVGIIGLLSYDYIKNGQKSAIENPLWLLFIITNIVMAFGTMPISTDHEKLKKSPSYSNYFFVSLLIGVAAALLTMIMSPTSSIRTIVLIGALFFICFLVPFTVLYRFRKKNFDDSNEEE